MSATRERPILFGGPMVRAILDGRKTQTRRVIMHNHVWKLLPGGDLTREERRDRNKMVYRGPGTHGHPNHEELLTCCPYGAPGDRLWVRETWGLFDTEPSDGPERATVFYRARDDDRYDLRYQRWRSPIHMPRWASRITLEVVRVRVERVQEISEADTMAEGVINHYRGAKYWDPSVRKECASAQIHDFMQLWDSINAKRGFGWAANPWVWVVEFKRVDADPSPGNPLPGHPPPPVAVEGLAQPFAGSAAFALTPSSGATQ